ncbi:MAG TPA: CHAT domain-containing protein [Thermoanaerobaculia bacterium]|nr:CHAT domain-containing protein [Thermoanaerobaculia bacterium]
MSAYGPLREMRSGSAARADAYGALAEEQARVDGARTPANLRRLAAAELVIGDKDAAHGHLAEAAARAPFDAGVMSDLAAFELTVGRISDAAEHSASALEVDRSLQSAAFNWALSLEKLSNRPAAIAAWKAYLALDSASGWAAEAHQHLARLSVIRSSWNDDRLLLTAGADPATIQRLVAKYPQHARTRIQNVLLPRWAESGDPADLALMQTMAAVRAADDPYLADVVANAGSRRLDLRDGFRAFKAACQAEDNADLEAARSHFTEAATIFGRHGSPLQYASAVYAASDAFFAGRAEGVLEQLQAIEDRLRAEGERYPSMKAETAWVRALVLMRGGRHYEAVDAFEAAMKAARRSGETENEVALGDLLATELEMIGDPTDSEEYRLAALRRSDEIHEDPERMYVAFAETAFSALRGGRPRVALAFIESQAAIARELKDPQRIAWTEGQRGLGLLQLGRLAEAESAVAAARQQALLISSEGSRDWALADIDYTAGRLHMLQARPDRAVTAFTSSLRIWDRYGWRLHTANGYAARAEAHLATADRRAAESDYRAGIGEMEKQRADLEPNMRVAYFERSDRLFQGLIGLLAEDGRPDEALSIVERKRARVMLEQIAAERSGAVPLDAGAIAAAVRGKTAILEIALLERSLELWLVANGRIVHARVALPAKDVEAAVARHLTAIAADDEAGVRREGRWLYDRLIAPVAGALAPDADLVIVPDGVLQAFPFATLVTPDGVYLIERHPLAATPSASVFFQAPAASAGDSLLAVAQPSPEGLKPLRSVLAEARNIAATYPRGRLHVGREITPAAFLDSAGVAGYVHFAGHARTDMARPARSALLFQSGGEQPAELTAREIGASRLPAHPLVVLAACSTGRGSARSNEGADSLATAFLQAGARGVVATLWDVDDASAARLFRAVHDNLRRNERPSDALRDAQRAFIHSQTPADRRPSLWASTALFGTQ